MWPTHFAKITRAGRRRFKSVRMNAKGELKASRDDTPIDTVGPRSAVK